LDLDLDPAPETTPEASDALADDLIAPPAEQAPVPESRASTRFVSNAAHDAEAGTPAPSAAAEPAARPASTSGGVIAGAAAAVGAVAAAAAAAMKKVGRSDRSPEPSPRTAPPSDEPATPEPAPPADAAAGAGAATAGRESADADGAPSGPWSGRPGTVEPDDQAGELFTAYPSARPGPAGAIYGVGITVLVTDLGRSIGFYRDTLGFYEIDSGDGSAVLASGDTRLVLRTVAGFSAEAGRLIYLNLEVGDVEAVYGELRAKGVHFVHPPQPVNRGDRLELWSATFRDPDDHNIAITQWRAIR
jgi:catechol 2,3-dioxygenase-like lactoylglutathione lyase family enzyme